MSFPSNEIYLSSTSTQLSSVTATTSEKSVGAVYDLNIIGTDEFSLTQVVYKVIDNFKKYCQSLSITVPEQNYALSILSRQIVELVKNTYDVLGVSTSEQIACQITLAYSPDHFKISYRDFGRGFPTSFLNDKAALDYREKLSDSDRIRSTKKGQLGGRGLGLARISQLAVAFGGNLILSNHPEGGAIITWSTVPNLSAAAIIANCPQPVKNHDLVLSALRMSSLQSSFHDIDLAETKDEVSAGFTDRAPTLASETSKFSATQRPHLQLDFESTADDVPEITVEAAVGDIDEDDGFGQRAMDAVPQLNDDGFGQRAMDALPQPQLSGSRFGMFAAAVTVPSPTQQEQLEQLEQLQQHQEKTKTKSRRGLSIVVT